MNVEKWIKTLDSRKAVAMGLAFVLIVLNKVLDWGMETQDIILLVSPLFAWAGIEGLLDFVKAKNGDFALVTPPAIKKSFSIFGSLDDLSALSTEEIHAAMGVFLQEIKKLEIEMEKRETKNLAGDQPPASHI